MDNTKTAQKIYTKSNKLYHKTFYGILKYDQGVKAFLKKSNYHYSRVLDVGCGAGLLTKTLYHPKKTFHAFDLTKAMLDLFKEWIDKNRIKNIELKQTNVLKLETLPKSWKKYDLIVTGGMLEYLLKENLSKTLKELKKLLDKKGKIVIFITKRNLITSCLIRRWWKANTYQKEEIKQIIFKAGFKKIKFKRFPSYKYLNQGMFIIEGSN